MESLLVALGTSSAIALLLSFYDGEAGNLMFDGGSLCSFFFLSQINTLDHGADFYLSRSLVYVCPCSLGVFGLTQFSVLLPRRSGVR